MKSARILNVLSLVFNVLLVGLLIWLTILNGGSISVDEYVFINYAAVTLASLFAFICIPFNIIGIVKGNRLPGIIYVLKLVGTTTLLVSMAFEIGVLGYINGFDLNAIFGGFDFSQPAIYLNLVIPAIALIGFVFFDHTEKAIFPVVFFGLIPASIYASFYQANVMQQILEVNGVYDWYNLLSLGQTGAIIALAILIVASLVIAIIIYLINFIFRKIFFRPEPKPVVPNYVDPSNDDNNDDDDDHNDDNDGNTNNAFAPLSQEKEDAPLREQELDEGDKEESNELYSSDEEEKGEENVEEPVEEAEEEEVEEEPVEQAEDGSKDEPEQPQEDAEEEPVEEPAPEEEKPVKKPVKKPAAPKKAPKKPAKEPEPAHANNGTKVYHLTKRKEDGMWAITFVGGKKPVKLFKTKKEAEEYLAVLTKNQGATALIRNSKGAKAGKFASSIKSDEDKK